MNADVLNKLPRYITGPFAEVWRIPDDFPVDPHENIFVRLSDVLELLEKEKNGKE